MSLVSVLWTPVNERAKEPVLQHVSFPLCYNLYMTNWYFKFNNLHVPRHNSFNNNLPPKLFKTNECPMAIEKWPKNNSQGSIYWWYLYSSHVHYWDTIELNTNPSNNPIHDTLVIPKWLQSVNLGGALDGERTPSRSCWY